MLRRFLLVIVLFILALVGATDLVGKSDSGMCYADGACEGDYNNDGDVDGSDLALFALYGSNLEEFALDFGRTDCRPSAPAPVEKTGQFVSYLTGDDGDLEKGAAWPIPRFTNNGDGTVTDNLTGLVWLRYNGCPELAGSDWDTAINLCNNLADGSCELTDGSRAGDWRLPNVKEIQSLIHYGYYSPALSNTEGTGQWEEDDPFANMMFTYWTATTVAKYPDEAFYVEFLCGGVIKSIKTYKTHFILPVRDKQ